MSFTSAHLAALDEAIASGATRVTYDGKTVEYRSLSELMAARATVQAQLTGGASSGLRVTHVNPVFSKGV